MLQTDGGPAGQPEGALEGVAQDKQKWLFMLQLIDDTEEDLRRIIPHHSHRKGKGSVHSLMLIQHLQCILNSQKINVDELETLKMEFQYLTIQCWTHKVEGVDDEETATKSKKYVIKLGMLMSILLLVADILQKIVALKKLMEHKGKKMQDMEDKWDDFKQSEQMLANWLVVGLQQVQLGAGGEGHG